MADGEQSAAKEQDRFLPIANISRIMKKVGLPGVSAVLRPSTISSDYGTAHVPGR